jgi:hypothetical protein
LRVVKKDRKEQREAALRFNIDTCACRPNLLSIGYVSALAERSNGAPTNITYRAGCIAPRCECKFPSSLIEESLGDHDRAERDISMI